MSGPWTLRITAPMMAALEAHLFPGDCDEHGAVIGASVVTTPRGTRLLARRLFVANDGVDYVAGQSGYRMLTASFVRDCALGCQSQKLAYLAVHCHGGSDEVHFSSDDHASHERGYPALLDIVDGPPVGALVVAESAAAGEIWLGDGGQVTLEHVEVVGRTARRLYPSPPARPADSDERYDRQARLFGDRGQALLGAQKVAVIGAGGAGSLLIEYLARLGVGELVVVDPDRIETSNLSRVVGARRRDVHPLLTKPWMPRPVRELAAQHRTRKVDIARRVALQAQPTIKFLGLASDVTVAQTAEELLDCDYLFLAADSMQARLLVNMVVHQYLICGVQMGAKVQLDTTTGAIVDLFSVVRPLVPGQSCLWCNGLISPAKLQEEATSAEQLRRQRYVDEVEIAQPSVITLNAVAAAHAANDYLLSLMGLLNDESPLWMKAHPREGEFALEVPRRDEDCPVCSVAGNLGVGRQSALPVRQKKRG